MNVKRVNTPFSDETVRSFRSGDQVELSGTVYTARDEVHKRLVIMIEEQRPLPFQIEGSVIFYTGPSPARPGKVIGSCGPTTSSRMDPYTPLLLKHGLKGMIGKGERSKQVVEAIKEYQAVYFGATGGAAALLARSVIHVEVIAFDDLGPEALRRLTVRDLPLVVINDCYGNDLYREGRRRWVLA